MGLHAQDGSGGVEPFEEFGKHLRAAQEVTPLKSNLFGDQVSLYNGSTEFNVVDIDLPGNSMLPVHLSRRLEIDDRRLPTGSLAGMGDWDLDVPYIDGVFTQQDDWSVVGAGQTQSYARCSAPNVPYTYQPATNDWAPTLLVWDGYQMHIPGVTSEELLVNTEAKLPAVTDGNTYPWVTKSLYRASCIGSTANGYPGEGFVVVTPSGVRYTFNWAITHTDSNLTYQGPGPDGKTVRYTVGRDRVFLLATQVTDRFGNWVKYAYNGDELASITSNDGREIDIAWSGGLVQSATAVSPTYGSRTWTYGYTNDGLNNHLSSVTQPDGSQWTYTIASGSLKTVFTPQDNEPNQPQVHCQIDSLPNTGSLVYVITSPSGATGTFNFTYGRQNRTYVPLSCLHNADPILTSYPTVYDFFDNFMLTSKQITGAGLTTQTWNYNYGGTATPFLYEPSAVFAPTNETYIPPGTCSTCPVSRVVTVTGPTEIQKYSFGVQYARNEGWLLQTETDALDGTVKKVEANTYLTEDQIASEPFPDNAGQQIQVTSKNPMVNRIRPVTMTTIAQDGDTYTHQSVAFNAFAQVTETKRFNSITGQAAIDESTSYLNDTTLWVLALPQQVTNNSNGGEVESTNTYNTNDTLQSRAKFGQTLMSYGYDGAGNVSSLTDGNNHTTNLTNYKRGIPQSLGYPDNTSQALVVDDFGEITSVTDQLGKSTQYSYDTMGRATQITYPSGDEVAWYPKTFTYSFVTSAERGLPANHWRRTIATGNNVAVTYFDAMLRPLLSDTGIGSTIISSALANYDINGQTIFASYPSATALSFTTTPSSAGITGTATTYDALERETQSQKDSELGTLTTTTAYLAGAGKQVTDPKGNVATTYYQVFDEPKDDAVIQLQTGGITQTISRDLYGNPLSITQSGVYGTENDSTTKTLTYDSYHRLCRTTEPESGSTVMAYDGANNLAWSADGVAVTGAGCGQEQVAAAAQTTRTYDELNRIKTLVPPSGTQSTVYGYDLAGRPNSAVSGISTWAATYNYRGLLTGESLQLSGQNAWGIGYAHDAYGTVSFVHYPDGENVSYAPDPLGRATQVGSYASGISYFPNGQVAQFLYGNGSTYVAAQNTRQLPSNFSSGTSSTAQLSEDLTYDKNGNLATVNDLTGGPRSKTFGYDTLDRITSAQAAGLWGAQAYTYDALNNLRTLQAGSQTATYNYDATNKLANISSGGLTISGFGYDNRGNTTTRNSANLLFDLKNQLTQIVGTDTYAYDAAGRRVQKTPQGGTPVYYFYNQAGHLMYQVEPGGAKTTNFIYLGSKLLVDNENVSLAQPTTIGFDSNPNNGSYTVSWSAVPTATSYTLQESANGSAWTTVYTGSATSSALSGKAGGSYVYQVQGCIGSTCSAWATSATLGVRPAVPTVTVPGGTINGTYSVGWTAPAGTTAYTVQESLNGGAWNTIASNTTATSISRPGTTSGNYTYQVSASNAYGSRGWAASSAVKVDTTYGVVPTASSSLTVPATSNNGAATLSWTAANLATNYIVQQSNNGGSTWTAAYNGSATSAALSGLADGSYVFHVQACNTYGCSPWTAGNATLVVTHPPTAAPTIGVPSGASANGTYTVNWTGVNGQVSYNLQEQVNGGAWTTVQNNAMTSWSTSGRGNGSYGYRVQACNVGGCGPWSVTGTVTVTYPPSTAPSLSIPGSSSNGSYTVSWSAVSGATSYTLQERVNGGGWTTIQTNGATSDALGSRGNGSYSYQVQACNINGCGPWSGTGTITVLYPPATPGLSVPAGNNTTGSYTVSWNGVATATGYNLQEQVNGGGWSTVYSGTGGSWSTSGRVNGNYGYQVQACNGSGCSAFSPVGTVSVAMPTTLPINGQAIWNEYTVNTGTGSALIGFDIVNGNTWEVFYNAAGNTHLLKTSGPVPTFATTVQYTWTLVGAPAGYNDAGGSVNNGAASPVNISSNPSSQLITNAFNFKSGSHARTYQVRVDFFNASGANINSSTFTLTGDVEGAGS